MTETTTNYSLKTYDGTEPDISDAFLNFRLDQLGPYGNMELIDAALHGLQEQIDYSSEFIYVSAAHAGGNVYDATVAEFPAAYALGQCVLLDVDTTNTGDPVLNINSLGNKDLCKIVGTGVAGYLAPNELVISRLYLFRYNGSKWIIVSDPPLLNLTKVGGRLSFSTTIPATSADVTAADTLYYQNEYGSQVSLWSAQLGAWEDVNVEDSLQKSFSAPAVVDTTNGSPTLTNCYVAEFFTVGATVTGSGIPGGTTVVSIDADNQEVTLSANATASDTTVLVYSTLLADKNYDVFIYDNRASTGLGAEILIEFVPWTDGTTRSVALVQYDGVFVKTGDASKRYMGTFRTTVAGESEDSKTKRFLWSFYNQKERMLYKEPASFTEAVATTWAQYGGATANKVEFVTGQPVEVSAHLHVTTELTVTNVGPYMAYSAIGADSIAVPNVTQAGQMGAGNEIAQITVEYSDFLEGYHYLAAMDYISDGSIKYGYTNTDNVLAGCVLG